MAKGKPRGTTPDEKAAKIEAVLSELEQHGNTREACRTADVPESTFREWRDSDEALAARYARAREIGIEARFERLSEIAKSETDVQRARLLVDVEKWSLSKIRPDLYGDRLAHTGPNGGPIQIEDLTRKKIAEAEAALGSIDRT